MDKIVVLINDKVVKKLLFKLLDGGIKEIYEWGTEIDEVNLGRRVPFGITYITTKFNVQIQEEVNYSSNISVNSHSFEFILKNIDLIKNMTEEQFCVFIEEKLSDDDYVVEYWRNDSKV